MLLKIITKTYRFILVILVLTILAVIGLVFFTINDPKFLSSLTPLIEKTINRVLQSDIQIKIGDNKLNWDYEHKVIELKSTDIVLIDKKTSTQLATLKSISIKPNLFKLFMWQIAPTEIIVDSPTLFLDLFLTPKLGTNQPPLTKKEIVTLTQNFAKKITEQSYLDLVSIYNAKVINQQNILKFSDFKINFYHNRTNTVVESNAAAILNQEKLQFNIVSMVQSDGATINRLNYTNLPISLVLNFVPSLTNSSFFEDNNVKLTSSGNFYVSTNLAGELEEIKINLHDTTGSLTNHQLAKTVSLTKLSSQVEISHGGKAIEIKELDIETSEGMKLAGNAIIDNIIYTDNNNFSKLLVNLTVEKFDIEDLAVLWPDSIYYESKQWVITRINHGIISKAHIKVDISPWHILANHYPEDIIAGEFEFNNFDLLYYKNFPVITQMKGRAKITGKDISISGTGALLDSKITAAKIYVPLAPNEEIIIEGKVNGLAHNLIEFIPDSSIADFDSITPHKTIIGNAYTDVKIRIPLLDDINYEDIIFNVNSKLKNIANSIPNLNLRSGEFNVNFTGDKVKLTGTSLLNDQTAQVKFLGLIKHKHMTSNLVINTNINPSSMGLNYVDLSKGLLNVETKITNFHDIEIKSNLTDTEFAINQLSFIKNYGDTAELDLKGNFQGNKEIKFTNLQLNGKNLEVLGNATLLLSPLKLTQANFNRIRLGYNDFEIGYKCANSICHTNILGNLLDLRNFEFEPLIKNADNEGNNLTLDLKTVLMKNDKIFVDISGQINCAELTGVKCSYASVAGNVGNDNPFTITLAAEGKKETWAVETDDAGLLSNGLNMYKNIKNGKLNLIMVRDFSANNLNNAKINGAVVVKDFLATKTSIFAKIISLSSLYGIIGGYRGDNMPFKKFSADFSFDNKNIQIMHGLADSHFLTLTMAGSLDMNSNQIDLRGNIIPELYGINSILGHIPLIGKLFGGPEGGLIAASYKISGSFDNSRTSINPLSILTPGFLRNIFNFSGTEKKKKLISN